MSGVKRLSVDIEWLRLLCMSYGKEKYDKLFQFCLDNEVSDLHSSNVGVIESDSGLYPVIIDCLSRSNRDSKEVYYG